MQGLCEGYAGAEQGLCGGYARAMHGLCTGYAGAMHGLLLWYSPDTALLHHCYSPATALLQLLLHSLMVVGARRGSALHYYKPKVSSLRLKLSLNEVNLSI